MLSNTMQMCCLFLNSLRDLLCRWGFSGSFGCIDMANKPDMLSFGENLKSIRAERGISQGELAELIGMHATHVSRYERDLTQPTLEVIRRMAQALGVSADRLVFGASEQRAKGLLLDQELLGLFDKVQGLSRAELGCVKSLLQAYVLKAELQQRLG